MLPSGIGRLGTVARTVAVFAALAGAPGATLAATYYVDPQSGSDANPGTSPAAPWRTPPGTRTSSNGGFLASAWGSVRTSSRVACGDRILLKGGATQSSAQGGAWLIDPTYYSDCTAGNPTTIKVATSGEWSGSNGHFTIDGSGITSTANYLYGWPGDEDSLIQVANVAHLHIRGASATQRLRIIDSNANGLTASCSPSCSSGGPGLMAGFWADFVEVATAGDRGVSLGRTADSKVSNTIAHDSYNAGFATGFANDHETVRTAFVDVEGYRNGANTNPFAQSDGMFFASRDIWCVRCSSHDSVKRGINTGVILNTRVTTDWKFRFRDTVMYNNGEACQPGGPFYCAGAGFDGSGDETNATAPNRVKNIFVGVEVFHNGDLGMGVYAGAGMEVWNASVYNSNYDRDDKGDFEWDSTGWQTSLFNVAHLATGAGAWGSNNSGYYQHRLTPVVRTSCFRHASSPSERLGLNWDGGAQGTYASPDAPHNDPSNLNGNACNLGWTSLHATSWSSNNWTPAAGSSLIDAGRFLMLANGAGSSATLTVKSNGGSSDPRDFFIGTSSYLSPSLEDRRIQIEGCGTRYVESMTATTITLNQSCTWANNAGVSLPWSGARPDIGAVESGGSSPPPPGPPPPPTLLPVEG